MNDKRDHRRVHPPVTAVRTAVQTGYGSAAPVLVPVSPARAGTESSGVVKHELDDMETAPADMSDDDASTFRQRQHREELLEVARGVGQTRIELGQMRGEIIGGFAKLGAQNETLIALATRADTREQRREDAAVVRETKREELRAQAAARREERDAEVHKAKATTDTTIAVAKLSRSEKVMLALIAGLVAIVSAFLVHAGSK